MAGFHTQLRMAKYDFKDYQLTTNLASGITAADIGKAVTWDNSADNQVKLAGNDDPIVGIIYTVENRVNEGELIGTIEYHFAAYLPIKSGLAGAEVVARGSKLIGAGAGEVRALDPAQTNEAPWLAVAPHCWQVVASPARAVATKFN